MGSAVNAAAGVGQSVINSVGGLISGSGGGNPLSALGGGIGQSAGSFIQPLVEGLVPAVPIANQDALQSQIGQLSGAGQAALNQSYNMQNQANQQMGQTAENIGYGQNWVNQAGGYLNPAQAAINSASGYMTPAQAAVNNAQQVNQGAGSNVNNAVGLLSQTAAGGGPAQQAAAAQLQAGTDKAIATQHAMANSGNLSEMIGGQKAAMMNAAQLQQANANQAAQLQAGMAATAQGQYAGAAAQQAGQAAQNAGLQQAQTAQAAQLANLQQGQTSAAQAQAALQQNQTNQQQALLNAQLASAQGYNSIGTGALSGAAGAETNALGIEQGALGQTADYRAKALGGLLNGAGGALSLISDKETKKDIKDTPASKFFRALNPKTFEYKESDSKHGKTPGTHVGIIAQEVEKAPGGKSMIRQLPEGKAIDVASAVGALMAHAAETTHKLDDIATLFKARKRK